LNNAVKILSDYLDNNSQAGVCGGNLYNENGLPANSFSRCFPSVFKELDYLLRGILFIIRYGKCRYFNYNDSPLKVACISGADMMLRASILSVVGGFDPDFFMYTEETELTYRIKKRGYNVYSVPQAKIIHIGGKSISNDIDRMKKKLTGRKIYYQKTHGCTGKAIVKAIFTLTVLSKFFLAIATGNKQKRLYWQAALRYV
jgi:GT2 family glycosyltransferase